MSVMALAPSWSDLHTDILSLVFQNFGGDFEYLSSSARVCVSWRSAVDELYQRLRPKAPFQLLLADDDKNNGSRVCLKDIQNLRTHITRINPGIQGRWIRSCSHGRLLTIGRAWPHEINLLHPLTGERIKLPPAGNQFNPSKGFTVVLSGYPSDSNCMVLGIHSLNQELVFCKPGDRAWTRINYSSCPKNVWFLKAISYKGEFYVLSDPTIGHYDFIGPIHRDPNDSTLFMEELIRMPPLLPMTELFYCDRDNLGSEFRYTCSYLVEFNDDLSLVLKYKYMHPSRHLRRRFEVYRLKLEGEKEWIPVKSLGNNCIYLDRASSISVSVGEDNSTECRANCIYFVERLDQCILGGDQCILRGVYDMGTDFTNSLDLFDYHLL